MKITHDIHAHTHRSLCALECATIANYVKSASELGITTIGIADHMWDETIPFPESFRHCKVVDPTGESVMNWYRAQSIPHCRTVLEEIREQEDLKGIHFLFGGEVEYAPGLGAAITMEEAEKLDFIIVPNSHTHMTMDATLYEPYEKHGDFMVRAIMEICSAPTAQFITSIAHPFCPVCCPYPAEYVIDAIPEHLFREVFSAAKEKGIAAEINSSILAEVDPDQFRNHWMYYVLGIAKDCGCRFTFGSDSHTDVEQYNLRKGETFAQLLGLTEEDLHPLVR